MPKNQTWMTIWLNIIYLVNVVKELIIFLDIKKPIIYHIDSHVIDIDCILFGVETHFLPKLLINVYSDINFPINIYNKLTVK